MIPTLAIIDVIVLDYVWTLLVGFDLLNFRAGESVSKKSLLVSGSDVAVAVLVSSSGRQMLALSGVSVALGVSLGCSYWFA